MLQFRDFECLIALYTAIWMHVKKIGQEVTIVYIIISKWLFYTQFTSH